MTMTHIELTAAADAMNCVDCGESEAREYLLVNSAGQVLARGATCGSCGPRHRTTRPALTGQVPRPR
ncbi:MAG TPA: hypothetical protein VHW44_21970 [Pseudonocardiaceae bacterium]|jgi:hypothetical protein|nr:hypothetical protein [Pseudonocardiaceae bacterium]